MVVAKFRVDHMAKFPKYDGEDTPWNIVMYPVQGEPFGKYTPSGKIEMIVKNDAASEQFIPGKEYLVTFEPV